MLNILPIIRLVAISADEINFNGNLTTIINWMTESYGLAVQYAYAPNVLSNGNLTDSYAANCVQVINRQVALAGVRRASIELFLFKEIRNKEKLFLEKVSFFKFVVRNFQLYIQII